MKKYVVGMLMCVMLLVVVTACNNNGSGNEQAADGTVAATTAPADANDNDDWVAPEIVTEPETEPPEAPGAVVDLNLVDTPTAGQLLGRDGVPLTRAEILAIVAEAPAPSGEIVMGDGTRIAGNFIGQFSSEAPGNWINDLLHGGRATMVMNHAGQFIPNPMVIREPTQIVDNADGTRTYTFFIYTDNVWSDGTPITAIDYVFSMILNSSGAYAGIGATVNGGNWIEGFQEMRNGRNYFGNYPENARFLDADGNWRTDLTFDAEENAWIDEDGETVTSGVHSNVLRGVRLHGDDSFSVTIRAEGIPFVFDFLYQSWGPAAFHYWNRSGQFTLVDTPDGVRIDGFYTDYLAELVNSPDGIRYNPTVVAGPYRLVSFDTATGSVIIERNPLFQGTWDGFMPQIQTIAIVDRAPTVIMDSLRIGEIDMVHAQRSGLRINEGWDIVNDLGLHRGADFPRHGYGYLAWHGDHGPSQFAHVRRAIAWLLDRQDFARQFTLGFGTVQHGPYALRGWEFLAVGHELYDHPDFTHYAFNPANAIAELEAGGWVLNQDGNPFDPAVDQWRYKDVSGMTNWQGEPIDEDGPLMRLEMIWAANDNDVSNIMRVVLPPAAEAVGMNIIEELYPSGTSNIPAWGRQAGTPYVRGGDRFRAHHIYTLAVGLANPNQVWTSWSNLPEFEGSGFNSTWHGDDLLSDLALAMRAVDASLDGWMEEYLDLWMQFQLRFNYLMPLLPLYADDDHDFVPLWLGNWYSNAVWNFPFAIQRAYDGR